MFNDTTQKKVCLSYKSLDSRPNKMRTLLPTSSVMTYKVQGLWLVAATAQQARAHEPARRGFVFVQRSAEKVSVQSTLRECEHACRYTMKWMGWTMGGLQLDLLQSDCCRNAAQMPAPPVSPRLISTHSVLCVYESLCVRAQALMWVFAVCV